MRHALSFSLRDDAVVDDHVQQSVLFREMVQGRPDWLTCVSYECGPHRRVLVIDVADLDRVRALPALARYLDHLAERCSETPAHDVDGAVDPDPAYEVGRWDPVHDLWCIPYGWWIGDDR
ncbi:hypothetical protein WCD74_29405 [Actinomycetospora sp. OC33-EN08]|uniref:Uncharacterized protein n=1 Tax=Actinomycetospora aurantiaca TaxID=3129233 RepID=A0ABU8MX78_9PSEU